MNQRVSFIRNIEQKDNHTLTILWDDFQLVNYRLSDIQQACPCAKCYGDGNKHVKDDVGALMIRSVGRYALRIEFTAGCSQGIYDFDLIRRIREWS